MLPCGFDTSYCASNGAKVLKNAELLEWNLNEFFGDRKLSKSAFSSSNGKERNAHFSVTRTYT